MKLSLFKFLILTSILSNVLLAEEPKTFDLSQDSTYKDSTGYGYDFNTKPQSKKNNKPSYFSIKVEVDAFGTLGLIIVEGCSLTILLIE